jgi:hypothetical protein
MVGADEDENRRWDIGYGIWKIGSKIKIKLKMRIGYGIWDMEDRE